MRGFNPLIYVTLIIFEATDKDICFTTLISVPDFFFIIYCGFKRNRHLGEFILNCPMPNIKGLKN